MPDRPSIPRVSTGITGLDTILSGGLPRGFTYLLRGAPGAGKTTAALHFARDGHARGDRVLYVTLSQTESELRTAIHSRGWEDPAFEVCELSADAQLSSAEAHQTLFHPGEVELEELTGTIIERVRGSDAARVVIDSMAEIRLLASDPLHYRRQVLALQQHLQRQRATVLMLDECDSGIGSYDIANIVHGAIELLQLAPEYGRDRRQIRVQKLRSSPIQEGFHDVRLCPEGLLVFPRLVAADHRQSDVTGHLSSGIDELDSLLSGGIAKGTSTLLMGPAGVGKSTLATQFVHHQTKAGMKAAIWLFDESRHTFFARSEALGVPVEDVVESGQVMMRQVDPAELSPGEFMSDLRQAVEEDGVQMVVVDSLNGFLAAMPGERNLTLHLHEVVAYLNEKNVSSILVFGQPGLFAPFSSSPPYDVTYLADTVLLARYYEYRGEVRKALSVFKKRADGHEKTIRDLELRPGGISVGEPLRRFRGVLSGLPEIAYEDEEDPPTTSNGNGRGDPHGGNP